MKRRVNIPIFIPHLGCPNQCVFCNQRTISGTLSFCEDSVRPQIEAALATVGDADAEIAFFGGSFTGIDRSLMLRLLDTAQSFVDADRVSGIRMSTRPDYIDDSVIKALAPYTIAAVELGAQSMTDGVLAASGRGHSAADTERAITLLRSNGYSVVGQMMLGLPRSTIADEIYCARRLCELGVSAARIYPTVVFKGTALAEMTETGEYAPLTVEDAVGRGAAVLRVFDDYGVPCIRIGLCDAENLHSESTYTAGPNHPALGELIRSRVWLMVIEEAASSRSFTDENIAVYCPVGAASQVAGQKRCNVKALLSSTGARSIKIIEKTGMMGYNIRIATI